MDMDACININVSRVQNETCICRPHLPEALIELTSEASLRARAYCLSLESASKRDGKDSTGLILTVCSTIWDKLVSVWYTVIATIRLDPEFIYLYTCIIHEIMTCEPSVLRQAKNCLSFRKDLNRLGKTCFSPGLLRRHVSCCIRGLLLDSWFQDRRRL